MSQLNPIEFEAARDRRRAEEYQAGQRFTRRETTKSVFQSALEYSKSAPIGQVVSQVGQVFGGAAEAVSPLFGSQVRREEQFQSTGIARGIDVAAKFARPNIILAAGIPLATKPITSFLGAAEAVGNAWETGVMRPLTTAALVTDPTSPLYRGEVYRSGEEGRPGGFLEPTNPLEAIGMAWERSESVDLGTATIANPLLTSKFSPFVATRALAIANEVTQINTYNPWSDKSVDEASQNPFHWFVASAINLSPDLILPPPIRSARIATQGAMGLRTTVQGAEDLAYLRGLWNEHSARKQAAESLAQRTDETVTPTGVAEEIIPEEVLPVDPYSVLIEDLAKETRWARILETNSLVANATGVSKTRLAKIIARTDDPNTINELILASRGDIEALYNLALAAPDDVWALANMNDALRNAWIEKGFDYRPTGSELRKVNQVFDSALKRNKYFEEVRDLFTTPAGFTRGGSTWVPTKSMLIEETRTRGRQTRYAVKYADYEDAPQWLYKTLNAGDGSPVTTFLQWSSSRQPLGTVSLSGTRPDDWVIELGAQLDSVPLFRGTKEITVGFEPALAGGELVPIRMPANVYRQQIMEELVREAEETNILTAWRNMEDKLVQVMADEVGVPVDHALAFVRGGRQTLQERYGYMAESGGYLFDAELGRIVLHPMTRAQLLDSFPTLPIDEIYRAMRSEVSNAYRLTDNTSEVLTSLYDAGMKFFRTNVLFKPSYLFKFGALEPLIVTYLAHGTIFADEGLRATLGNVGKNWARRSKKVAYVMRLNSLARKAAGEAPAKTRKETQTYLRALVTERYQTQRILDNAIMELRRLQNGSVSPWKRANTEDAVRADLVEAQLRLNAIDDALDGNMPQWRQIVEPASYADAERKIAEYRAILGENPQYIENIESQIAEINRVAQARSRGGEISYTPVEERTLARLEASLERAKTKLKDMDKFRDDVVALEAYMDEVADLTEEFVDPARNIEELNKALLLNEKKWGIAQVQQGKIRRKADAVAFSGYVGSGSGYSTIVVGGEKFQVPGAFSTRQFDFGDALRQEASVATANRLLYDPSYSAAKNAAKWERTADPVLITPDNPMFWEELAYTTNRYLRDDLLVGRILRGDSKPEVAAWLRSPEGIKYQKTMGKDYLVLRETYSDPVGPLPKMDPTTGERIVAPSKRPRMLLQSTTELDEMFRLVDQYLPDAKLRAAAAEAPVTPGQLQEALGNNPNLRSIVGDDLIYNPKGKGEQALAKLNSALDKVWKWIATDPEDRIARWPFFVREFNKQLEMRANILSSQGVKMSPEQFDALRQAARRAAIDELDKTYYNIRRYNSLVYSSRFLTVFPGAFFNAIYRYGRFAVTEPERTAQSLLIADKILGSGSINEDGEVVPLGEAKYILIPGTKKNEGDTGLRVPVQSLETLAVAVPGASYIINLAVSQIVKNMPDVEDAFRNFIGEGAFEELFPYGFPRSATSTLFASYQRNFGRAFSTTIQRILGAQPTDRQFIQTSVQFYSDKMAQWERDGADPDDAPTFDDAMAAASGYYLQKAFLGWFPPFSVQVRPPGQLWRDAWYDIREQNGGDTQQAREIALNQYGDWFRWYTYSSSDYTAYIPSTVDAYKRIYQDYPDLTRELVGIAGDDLSMISLMTLGTTGEFSQPVSDFLRDNPLPGDDVPVSTRMTPEQFQNMVLVDDGWNEYSRERAKFDAEQNRLRILRDAPDIDSDRKDLYRSMIAQNELSFAEWVDGLEQENVPWAVNRTRGGQNRAERASIFLRKMLANPRFAAREGRTPLFRDIGDFLNQRDRALKAMRESRNDDIRKANKQSFVEYVNSEFLQKNPDFALFFDRYFSSEWMD